MRRALAYAQALGGSIIQYPEDPSLSRQGLMNDGEMATRLGLAGIPHEAEVIMVERDMRLDEATGCALHLRPISTATAVEVIRRAKARGLPITSVATPAHITLHEFLVEGYLTFAKIQPPLRSRRSSRRPARDDCPQGQDGLEAGRLKKGAAATSSSSILKHPGASARRI
jgi:dihydroorotase